MFNRELTADIVITTSALAIAELVDTNAKEIAFQSSFEDLHKKHENKISN